MRHPYRGKRNPRKRLNAGRLTADGRNDGLHVELRQPGVQIDRKRFAAERHFHRGLAGKEVGVPRDVKLDQPWIGENPIGDWYYAPGYTYEAATLVRSLLEYAARGGLQACVIMPEDTPLANIEETRIAGAEVILVPGLISDAARLAAEKARHEGWFDVSTFKEPYRTEGKKVMGLELAEGFGWRLPEVIIYPTGGGTGLVGMWKAFAELEALGWLESPQRPRMVAVQAEGCAPFCRYLLGIEVCDEERSFFLACLGQIDIALMLVTVMNIREMAMAVLYRRMGMRMAMRFLPIPREIVHMLMMLVVRVLMAVQHAFVGVLVPMSLAQVQPYPKAHQSSSHPEWRRRGFAK